MSQSLPALIFLLPFVGALLCAIVGWLHRSVAYWIATATLGLTVAAVLGAGSVMLTDGTVNVFMGNWAPPLGIAWRLDRLTFIGVAMVAAVAFTVIAGSQRAVRLETPGREIFFYSCSLLLVSGLMGMLLTADLFNLFVFVEVVSLSSYALVGAGGVGAPLAAMRYLIIGSIGASFYLLGVGFLLGATGSLNMDDVASLLPTSDPRLVMIAIVLITVGLSIKMGLFPLHGWMPGAYSRCPVVSSSLMAPLVTKVSALALIRIIVSVYGLDWLRGEQMVMQLLAWTGAVAMIAGGLLAFLQSNLRRMLAMSSVAQIGLVVAGLGQAGSWTVAGSILHVLSDSLMKSTLFLAAGIALLHYGIERVDQLGRLRGRSPWLMAFFTIGGLSLLGIPPLCGFFGKYYVIAGALRQQHWALAAAVILGSVMSGLYVFHLIERINISKNEKEEWSTD